MADVISSVVLVLPFDVTVIVPLPVPLDGLTVQTLVAVLTAVHVTFDCTAIVCVCLRAEAE